MRGGIRAGAALAAVLPLGLTACTSGPGPEGSASPSPRPKPSASSTPEAAPEAPTDVAGGCGNPTVTVDDAAKLQQALDSAQPGQTIELLPGTYVGEFTASAS